MVEHADKRPTVLLTGFGPFPGVPENASADLVREIMPAARREFPDFRFVAAVLPTEWQRAPQLIEILHKRFRPLLALHFGVASGMRGFRIETEARNFCRMSPDAVGALPALTLISEADSEALPVTIDAKAAAQNLGEKGYHATLSSDAGGYLCNAVLYHSLAEAGRRGGRCKVAFVHVPAETRLQDTLGYAVPGALEILKFVLEASPSAIPLTSV